MPRILKATASSSATNALVILGGRATSGSYLLRMNLLIVLGEAAQKSRFMLVTLPTSGPVSWQ